VESEDKEKAAALDARKQMTAAALIITLSFVFVFVAIALGSRTRPERCKIWILRFASVKELIP
jgi:hypothetical membrane protein